MPRMFLLADERSNKISSQKKVSELAELAQIEQAYQLARIADALERFMKTQTAGAKVRRKRMVCPKCAADEKLGI